MTVILKELRINASKEDRKMVKTFVRTCTKTNFVSVMEELDVCSNVLMTFKNHIPDALVGIRWGRLYSSLICFVTVSLSSDTHILIQSLRRRCIRKLRQDRKVREYKIVKVSKGER